MTEQNRGAEYEQLVDQSQRREEQINRIQRYIARNGGGPDPSPELDGVKELFEEE